MQESLVLQYVDILQNITVDVFCQELAMKDITGNCVF
jgi:hypothetical protein